LGEEKLILIGHSFGAFLALLYAAEFSEHIQALVLIAPANLIELPQKEGGLFEEIRQNLPASMQKEYQAYLDRYLDFGSLFDQNEQKLKTLNAQLTTFYAAAAQEKGDAPNAWYNIDNGGWMVQAAYLSMGKSHDYRPAIQKIDAPVLVIHGNDDLQPKDVSREFEKILPNASFVSIDNANHFVFNEPTRMFTDTVRQFLLPFQQQPSSNP
jgi:proline iminopeptidase